MREHRIRSMTQVPFMGLQLRLPFGAPALLLSLAGPVHAEAMDKMPAQQEIWTVALCAGVFAIIAWRYRKWLGLITTSLLVVAANAAYAEFSDPALQEALQLEVGTWYLPSFYSAVATALALNAVGAYMSLKSFIAATTRPESPPPSSHSPSP